ncbi:MAG TPA: helix-turn-helix domain-containing protein [Steroidobacteraceae bacterium]|nr:helix-turn-helix domain-containing protein [Steroidobacteraceae bacterium]
MGRRAVFDRNQMTGAALRLVAERGPQAVTVSALAQEVGAPTGSIYHRYRSREQLLAELWMEVVEGFQNRFVESLAQARDVEGAISTARLMVAWTREHPLEARLLLLHRRQDFVSGEWPAELAQRAAALEPQLGTALRAFADRAFGRADAETMARLRYALLDAPFGALRPYVQGQKRLPAVVDELVIATARAVLASAVRPGNPKASS